MTKNKILLPLILVALIAIIASGCDNSPKKDPPEPIELGSVTFQLTDELKTYMDSEDLRDIAFITTLCYT